MNVSAKPLIPPVLESGAIVSIAPWSVFDADADAAVEVVVADPAS